MKFLSLCSGIEAASVALGILGWQALAFSEVAPFPCAVLAHLYPNVPNLGDMTRWEEWPEELLAEVDALLGGTPCQAFSLAGEGESLDDPRGQLTLCYARILNRIDEIRARYGRPPVIFLWENVPGVLSTKDNAFGCFLGLLAGEDLPLTPPGGKWTDAGYVRGPARAIAWRSLDAQYFDLAQRRERVFAVGSARAGFRPESVLFESEGMRRDSPPRRESREGIAPTLSARPSGGGGLGTDFDLDGGLVQAAISPTVSAKWAKGSGGPSGDECQNLIVPPLTTRPYADNDGREGSLIAFDCKASGQNGFGVGEVSPTLRSMGHANSHQNAGGQVAVCTFNLRGRDACHPLAAAAHAPAVAFSGRNRGAEPSVNRPERPPHAMEEKTGALETVKPWNVAVGSTVRRLTPRECERLQGFPDDYTRIPGWNGWRDVDASEDPEELRAEGLRVRQTKSGKWRVNDPDGPRYKALGNSWAVPCVTWIGARITAEASLTLESAA